MNERLSESEEPILSTDTGLVTILRHVPAVLHLLSAAALKSLLTTSAALRQVVHRHVQVLHIPPGYPSDLDIQLLVNGGWRCLEDLQLNFTDLDAGSIKQLQKASWPNLRRLSVAGRMLDTVTMRQLQKRYWLQLEVLSMGNPHALATPPAIKHLQIAAPMLKRLHLPNAALTPGAVTRLAQVHLPQLQHLDLSGNNLTGDEILPLGQSIWPQLTTLEMGGNDLSAAAVSVLTSGMWPLLQTLDVQRCGLNLSSLSKLLQGPWPKLSSLNLAHNELWTEGISMTTPWSGLKRLNLTCTGLTEIHENWWSCFSAIEDLNLSQNLLSDLCGCYLVTTPHLACLTSLSLQHVDLVISAASGLGSVNWSLLEALDLSNTTWDITAVDYTEVLIQADWPRLKSLCLARVSEERYGAYRNRQAERLIRGHWPNLEVLNFDQVEMSEGDAWSSLELLVHWQWALKTFSMRGCVMNRNTMQFLLQCGWKCLERLHLPYVKEMIAFVLADSGKILCAQICLPCLSLIF